MVQRSWVGDQQLVRLSGKEISARIVQQACRRSDTYPKHPVHFDHAAILGEEVETVLKAILEQPMEVA